MVSNEKKAFIEKMKARSKKFAIDVILFTESMKKKEPSEGTTYQLVKSASSVAANYGAACIARSKKEFFSKMCIVVEEADESEFWLDIIYQTNMSNDLTTCLKLQSEALELTKIMAKAKSSMY